MSIPVKKLTWFHFYTVTQYIGLMDSEKDIQNAAQKLVKDNGYSKIQALSMLLSKYQSDRRSEEAVIVRRLIKVEQSKAKGEKDTRYYDDT
jgi:hypothetical protein